MRFTIRRFVRALPAPVQALICALFGHELELDTSSAPLRQTCARCPYVSPGLAAGAPPVITQPGDPRASAMTSRRTWQGPEELPVDWHADEHFQGGHARVG